MYLRETGLGSMDSSGLGLGLVQGFCEHDNEPSGSVKC
jgi:hypothetical protein